MECAYRLWLGNASLDTSETRQWEITRLSPATLRTLKLHGVFVEFLNPICSLPIQLPKIPNHVDVLKNLRLSQKDLSSRIRPILTPSSIVPACTWGSNHNGKEKANHANTQTKPINLNALDSLYPMREPRAITASSNVIPTAWRRKN